MNIFKKSKGFTLIELLIVISIIVILTIIIFSSFGQAQVGSRDKKRIADISSIQLTLETYFNQHGYYSTTTVGLPGIPTPSTNPSGQQYQYNYVPLTQTSGSSVCTSYQLWTTLEGTNQYLASRKGFNSYQVSTTNPNGNFYLCLGGDATQETPQNESAFVYDVMPQ